MDYFKKKSKLVKLLVHSPFLISSFLKGKKKGVKNNQSSYIFNRLELFKKTSEKITFNMFKNYFKSS